MTISEYRRLLDPIVKPREFKGNGAVKVHVFLHLALVTSCALAVALNVNQWPLWAILAMAVLPGHSIACLGLAAHEIGQASCHAIAP